MQIDIQVLDKHFYLKKPLLKGFCRHVIENAWLGADDALVSVVLASNAFVHKLKKISPPMCCLLKMSHRWPEILLWRMV